MTPFKALTLVTVLKRTFATLPLLAMIASPALAAEKRELIGSFRDWDAIQSVNDKGQKTCYILSSPKDTEISRSGARRGDIYMTVTHRPAYEVTGEVNVVVGYPLRAGSEMSVSVDGKHSFRLFTEGNGAWTYDPQDDADLVKRMKAGLKLVARGVSHRGTRTADTYSLSGFTAAYNAISKACGVSG
ncbi:invasion associated locus B family protein [Yunchengibacter salinarum]|uniref:invasion associated locus B family protein n=1 Tax=Yunchengibacter salinarum TaxID=3133399 RepID=UPI0035B6055D